MGTFVFVSAIMVTGCSGELPASLETFRGQTMGTTYNIRVVVPTEDPNSSEGLHSEIDAVLVEVNRKMSTYDPKSELSKFNQSASTDWQQISLELASVVELSHQISEQSGGAFDITVGPAVNLWNFGPDKKRKQFPTDDEISDALKKIGYQQLEVSVEPPKLKKSSELVYVDLSAIAKGYGVDEVARLLKERGFTDFMVEIGGEVYAAGIKPNGDPWQIGVEKPTSTGQFVYSVVGLSGMALATSGDYRNFFEHKGVRYSHTIDPTTGRPVKHNLTSVSVMHSNCAKADAYATTLLVLGPDEGYNLAQKHNLAALFQIRQKNGEFEAKETTAWQQLNQ